MDTGQIRYNLTTPVRHLSAVELFRLCGDCRDRDAWHEFHRRYQPVISRVIRAKLARSGVSDLSRVDDLIQEVYLRLFRDGARALRQFAPRHANADLAFLKVIACNVVTDSLRKSGSEIALEEDAMDHFASESGIAPDLDRQLLVDSITKTVADLGSDRDREVFHLYFRVGFSAAQISRLQFTGLSVKGVESIIGRVVREIRSRMALHSHAGGRS